METLNGGWVTYIYSWFHQSHQGSHALHHTASSHQHRWDGHHTETPRHHTEPALMKMQGWTERDGLWNEMDVNLETFIFENIHGYMLQCSCCSFALLKWRFLPSYNEGTALLSICSYTAIMLLCENNQIHQKIIQSWHRTGWNTQVSKSNSAVFKNTTSKGPTKCSSIQSEVTLRFFFCSLTQKSLCSILQQPCNTV